MTNQDQEPVYDGHRGKGECPDCGGWFRIAGGGAVKPHGGELPGLECPGSGQPPARPVPCGRCGRAGIALPSAGLCGTCARLTHPARRGGLYVTGICGECGRPARLRGDGLVWQHRAARTGERCGGEGQLPAGETRR